MHKTADVYITIIPSRWGIFKTALEHKKLNLYRLAKLWFRLFKHSYCASCMSIALGHYSCNRVDVHTNLWNPRILECTFDTSTWKTKPYKIKRRKFYLLSQHWLRYTLVSGLDGGYLYASVAQASCIDEYSAKNCCKTANSAVHIDGGPLTSCGS